MADREYSSTDAAHGLSGFSSSSQWAAVQETGAWSHYPSSMGPKEGFHDPAGVEPARQQLPLNIEEV